MGAGTSMITLMEKEPSLPGSLPPKHSIPGAGPPSRPLSTKSKSSAPKSSQSIPRVSADAEASRGVSQVSSAFPKSTTVSQAVPRPSQPLTISAVHTRLASVSKSRPVSASDGLESQRDQSSPADSVSATRNNFMSWVDTFRQSVERKSAGLTPVSENKSEGSIKASLIKSLNTGSEILSKVSERIKTVRDSARNSTQSLRKSISSAEAFNSTPSNRLSVFSGLVSTLKSSENSQNMKARTGFTEESPELGISEFFDPHNPDILSARASVLPVTTA